jgi:hypothetical protein
LGQNESVGDMVDVEAARIPDRGIMQIGAPFVPIKHEGTIYIRPPLS